MSSEVLPSTISSATRRPAIGSHREAMTAEAGGEDEAAQARDLAQHGNEVRARRRCSRPSSARYRAAAARAARAAARPGCAAPLPGSAAARGLDPTPAAAGAPPSRAARRPGSPAAAVPRERNMSGSSRSSEEEAELAHGIERDVVVEGPPAAMLKLPSRRWRKATPLPHTAHAVTAGAGVGAARRFRAPSAAADRSRACARREDQAPAAQTTAGARISPRSVTTPATAPAGWSRPDRTVQVQRRPPERRRPRANASVVFSGSACRHRRVMPPGQPPASPGTTASEIPRARSRRVVRPNSRATGSHASKRATRRRGGQREIAAPGPLDVGASSARGPAKAVRPRRRRQLDGSRPCWRTKPQFFRDCSPGTSLAPRRRRACHGARGKYAVAQPTIPAPTTTSPRHAPWPRRIVVKDHEVSNAV